MKKANAASSFSTRMLMVGCLLSGSFAFIGEVDALTLPVTGGKPVVVRSVTIKGPNFPELTISGDMVDKLVALRAKGVAATGRDFGSALLAAKGFTVTALGVDGKLYIPMLTSGVAATGAGAGGLTLNPAK